jgi:hypothetical protein
MCRDEYIEERVFESKCFPALHERLAYIFFCSRYDTDDIPFRERFRRKIEHNNVKIRNTTYHYPYFLILYRV